MIEVLILMASMGLPPDHPSQAATSCSNPSASVHFACKGLQGERVAICESRDDASTQRNFRLELSTLEPYTAPNHVLGSPKTQLMFNHYSRFQTEYLEIAAREDGFEYRVYRHYLGDFGEQEPLYGVVITKLDDGTETHTECAGEVVDKLAGLPPFLECDVDSALGCGAFERVEPEGD